MLAAAPMAASALLGVPTAPASAAACPDVEVIFARGTTEAPGVGGIGQSFVDDVRSRVSPKSVGVYAVQYPASTDFPTGVIGIGDASAHIQNTAANCPNTRIVLGGYSQGAAVMGFVTADAIPAGSPPGAPSPMPASVADHVAAVALFGKPSPKFMAAVEEPTVTIGPLYADKTTDLCVPGDPVCSDGGSVANHGRYVPTGLVDQAATFVAARV
nr:cutinase family protein [Mycolicibacterium komossense]